MTSEHHWVGLCPLNDLADEAMCPFQVGEQWVSLYTREGAVYATDNVCSHAFAILTDGWFEDGIVECPLHGAQFDVKTGQVLRGPATAPIRTFATRIRDGMVEVDIQSKDEGPV